jgi:predicted Fe-Mo cluster-binding NifX family protein
MLAALTLASMERIAIPVWEGRISPVLDTAERLWVCDLDAGPEFAAQVVAVQPVDIGQRTQLIRDLGIHTLLCGAVSRQLHHLLLRAGVAVMPWLSGTVEDIATAYSEGRLTGDRFLLPGCRQRRRRGRSMGGRGGRGRRRQNKEPL